MPGSSSQKYSLLRKWWSQTGRVARGILVVVFLLVLAGLIARWVSLPVDGRYMFPKSADDWGAWGTWIGSLGAAAALFYAAISFQENWKDRDEKQQELLNDAHTVAKLSASKLRFSILTYVPKDRQYVDEAMKEHEAEIEYHKSLADGIPNGEQPFPEEHIIYVLISNVSEHDVFEDVSLRLMDSHDRICIADMQLRNPLPQTGREGSIPGGPPPWNQESLSASDEQYSCSKYLGSLAPNSQLLLKLRFKNPQMIDMKWNSSVISAFGIPPEGEMLCRFRDEAGRYWHRSNRSMSDELFRTWMAEDEPTTKQLRASQSA